MSRIAKSTRKKAPTVARKTETSVTVQDVVRSLESSVEGARKLSRALVLMTVGAKEAEAPAPFTDSAAVFGALEVMTDLLRAKTAMASDILRAFKKPTR